MQANRLQNRMLTLDKKSCTWPFLESTQRESPAFPIIIWLPLIRATHAVHPSTSGPL